MSNQQEFITHDFNLPCHDNELSKADDVIGKIKFSFNKHNRKKTLSDAQFIMLYEDTIKVLDYIGRLSMFAFAIEDEIEELYKMKFLHAPQLGKALWQEHYQGIHHPYNLLKNRCFKILDELDELYQIIHSKHPPNWKI